MIFGNIFTNLYDFWTSYYDQNKSIFSWYSPKICKLEMNIRRKWKSKDLPKVSIIIKKYREKKRFFQSWEIFRRIWPRKVFWTSEGWKIDVEESYLNEHPYLRFGPIRHKNVWWINKDPVVVLLSYIILCYIIFILF